MPAQITLKALLLVGTLPLTVYGDSRLTVPDAVLGQHLQAFTTVALSAAAPEGGVEVALTSSDPTRLLLSKTPLQKGTASLTLKVRAGLRESPEFWLQGVTAEGTTTYRALAPGYEAGEAKVTLTPSAIVLKGPIGGSSFQTVAGAAPLKLSLVSARLDATLKFAEEQLAATSVDVQLASSNAAVGTASPSLIPIPMGASSTAVLFQPVSEGQTTLSAAAEGFSTSATLSSVEAKVLLPGLAVSDHLTLGRDLQVAGVLSLGVAAPAAGTSVTLTSSDPRRLVFSDSATRVGSPSLTLTVGKGQASANYYLQALGDSGTVTYTASAKGFRDRTAAVMLAPSGIVITPANHGPPDEAQVMRSDPGDGLHTVFADTKKGTRTSLAAWTVQLDPVTHHAADITVQPLRAGLVITIPLTNSDPKVGRIVSSLKIAGGSERSIGIFESLRPGSTRITVQTPKGFTESANSTSVVLVLDRSSARE